MSERIKKKRLIQIIMLTVVIVLIIVTYYNPQKNSSNRILSEKAKSEISKKIDHKKENNDTFYNIEYSGLDFSGNRYILKAKEAFYDQKNENLINLKHINAFFYFKDETVLSVNSDRGLYNNKTLDMTFENNVSGKYETSSLFAEKAEYSNSEGFLIVSNNVKITDIKGTMSAEKLLFDLKENKLNISSEKNEKINAKINYK